MVNAERDGLPKGRRDYYNEVNGIMVGYQGHVPRAMDAFGMSHWKGQPPNPKQHQQSLYQA